MRLPETRDVIVNRLSFPVGCEEAMDEIGDLAIESPQGNEERLSEIIGRCGEREFESADELYDSIVGSVSAEHVGRQGYDDRGPSLEGGEEVSF